MTLNLAQQCLRRGDRVDCTAVYVLTVCRPGANGFTANQIVAGSFTATAFAGNGAGLAGVNPVSPASAATATTAATPTNAVAIGGNVPSYCAITGASTFTGNQTKPDRYSVGRQFSFTPYKYLACTEVLTDSCALVWKGRLSGN